MRTVKSWIRILGKKTLVNRAFIILLVLIPLLSIFMGMFGTNIHKANPPKIYLYAREDDPISEAVMDSLLGVYKGYSFVEADSEEQIQRDVRTHNALCGYIFAEDQMERVEEHTVKGNIVLVERIGNIETDIVNEIVFSAYYKEYTKYYTISYMDLEEDLFVTNYENIVTSSSLHYSADTISSRDDANNAVNRSARNIIGVILCLFAMLNISEFISDTEHSIFYPVKPKQRFAFRAVYFSIPILMLSPFVLIGTMIQETNKGFFMELGQLLLYDVILIVLSIICSFIIKKRHIILGMIPMLTILYIILCPVFLDLSIYLPVIRILRYFCPPFYFMM